MSLISDYLRRLQSGRTAEQRWDERWADPTFHAAARIDELAHHCVLAGYALRLAPGGALLDVGCGDGELRPLLHPDAFASYVGIDFAEAVARAQPYADAKTTFAAADMRTYQPAASFDTIVFNESLYYVEEPLAQLDRYAKFLTPGGVFLVSMHRKPKSERIWTDIGRRFEMIDRVLVSNRSAVEWIVGAFRPIR
jgi:2-polyprenyl-3-methyl-5-hydroxy-6-metoxy-1,4-benzoquinol methylase